MVSLAVVDGVELDEQTELKGQLYPTDVEYSNLQAIGYGDFTMDVSFVSTEVLPAQLACFAECLEIEITQCASYELAQLQFKLQQVLLSFEG